MSTRSRTILEITRGVLFLTLTLAAVPILLHPVLSAALAGGAGA